MMKHLNYAVIIAFLLGTSLGQTINHLAIGQMAVAQSTIPPLMASVIATCGSGVTYTANTLQPVTQNTAGSLCVNQ